MSEHLSKLKWAFGVNTKEELVEYMSQHDYNLVFSSLDSFLHDIPVTSNVSKLEKKNNNTINNTMKLKSKSFLDELETEIGDCMLLTAYGEQLLKIINNIIKNSIKVTTNDTERLVPENSIILADIPYQLSILYNLFSSFQDQCEKLKNQITEHFNTISNSCTNGNITVKDAEWIQNLCSQCLEISNDIEMHSNNSTLLRFVLKDI